MQRKRFGAALVLGFLISSGCAVTPRAVRLDLPEPPLPACFVEEAPQNREAVGPYQFAPSWTEAMRGLEDPKSKLAAALQCAADTARALREAVNTIRLNNRP